MRLTREQIEAAHKAAGGNTVIAAKALGVKRTLFYYYVNATGAVIERRRTAEQAAEHRRAMAERRNLTVVDIGKGPVRSDGVSVAVQVAGVWYAWRISDLMKGDYSCSY